MQEQRLPSVTPVARPRSRKNPTLPSQGLVWRGIFVMSHEPGDWDSDTAPQPAKRSALIQPLSPKGSGEVPIFLDGKLLL